MKYLTVCVWFVCICSCNQNAKKESLHYYEVETLIIDKEKQTAQLDTSQYTVSKVIPLRGDEQIILPQCDKMAFYKNRIYILDKLVNRSVFVFDSLGNYLYKVGEVGHALNELYREPTDFSINRKDGCLYLFENESQKIIKYDNNGEYRSAIVLENIWPYAFALTDEGNYAFAFRMLDDKRNTYELSVYDSLEQSKSNYRPLSNHQLFTKNFPFWQTDDQLFYIPNLSDTVFVLASDTLTHAIHVDFKGDFLPQKAITALKQNGKLSILADYDGYVYGLTKYEENDYWINVDYSIGINLHYLKNKQNGKEYNFSSLYKGFFPADLFFIHGQYLVYLLTEDNVADILYLKDKMNEWNALYKASNKTIQMILDGKIPTPTLIYIELK